MVNYLKNRLNIELSVTPLPTVIAYSPSPSPSRPAKVTPAPPHQPRSSGASSHGLPADTVSASCALCPAPLLAIDSLAAQREGEARELAVLLAYGLPTSVLACPGSAYRFAGRRP